MEPVTCARPRCGTPPTVRGLCQAHYSKLMRAGQYHRVPATDAAKRITELSRQGWSIHAIAVASGVSMDAVTRIRRGQPSVWDKTDRAIKGIVDTAPPNERVYVPSIGTVRRAQALAHRGWSLTWQATECGLYPNTLSHLLYTGQRSCMYRTHRLVSELYDRYWNRPGPSKKTRTDAINKGWVSPLAWDDNEIDDPKAKPRVAPAR